MFVLSILQNNKSQNGFTLVEILVVIAILAILAVAVVVVLNPASRFQDAQYSQALAELRELAHAVDLYLVDNSGLPADTARGVPPIGLDSYTSIDWTGGPFSGSQYDFDNWAGASCIDTAADGTVQVTLRNVPGRNPDGSDTWAWYYVLSGTGTPHCNDAGEQPYGECVNCEGFSI